MTTIGNRTHIVTLSPGAPVVTITGPITAYGSAVAYGQGGTLHAAVYGPADGFFTLSNVSSVVSVGKAQMGVGVLLGQTGSFLNTGLVYGGNGVAFLDDGAATASALVENAGTITGYGTVNYGAGVFYGPEFGVGVLSMVAGNVENTGTISGDNAGVLFRAAPVSVGNGGVITSSAGYGVVLEGAGTVANSGAVYGYLQGVLIGGSPAIAVGYSITARVVENAGVIAAGASPLGGYAFVSDAVEVIGAGTVTNYGGGTIADAGGNGVFLFAKGTGAVDPLPAGVTNAGLIEGLYGVEFYGAGSVGNSGSIVGQNIGVEIFDAAGAGYNAGLIEAVGVVTAGGTPSGVLLQQAGVFTNAAGGVVAAPGGNAVLLRQGGTIDNGGGITGGLAGIVGGGTGAPVVIETSGAVSGTAYGVYLSGAALVTNNGFVGGLGAAPSSSTDHYFSTGVFLAGGAEGLYNAGSGTIFSRSNYAVELMAVVGGPQEAQVLNTGLIEGLGGVRFFGLGGVVNYATILGTAADGIVLHYNGPGVLAGSVVNTGLIEASLTAVYSNGPAVVVNRAGGVIKGQGYGVALKGATGSYLANSGYIGGNVALWMSGGSRVVNAGTLVGGSLGVALLQGGTLVDGGVIAGAGGGAVYFEAGYHNALVLEPGAEILGSVHFGGGVLDLAGGGEKGVVALKTLAGFTALTIAAGAEWELQGKTSLAKSIAVVNDGTIKQAGGDSLTIAGVLSGDGTIEMAKAPLVLNGMVAAGQAIGFTGTGETLTLGAPKTFHAQVRGFRAADTIDLSGVSLSAITGLSFANGVLTLTEATGALHIAFANPGSFGTETFGLAAAGAGVDVTLGKMGAVALAWPTIGNILGTQFEAGVLTLQG